MLEPIVVSAEPVGIGVLLFVPVAGAPEVPVAGAVPVGCPIVLVWPVAGIWFWG
jgi:hypothetical protein